MRGNIVPQNVFLVLYTVNENLCECVNMLVLLCKLMGCGTGQYVLSGRVDFSAGRVLPDFRQYRIQLRTLCCGKNI